MWLRLRRARLSCVYSFFSHLLESLLDSRSRSDAELFNPEPAATAGIQEPSPLAPA
jgi:hypothetical protein